MRAVVRVCIAWIVLHCMSISLAVCGFDRTYRLATWFVRPPRESPAEAGDDPAPALSAADKRVVDAAVAALGRAKRYHLRMTADDCLPVALTGVILLGPSGLEPRLILGVKKHPFGAHSWVAVHERNVDFPPSKYKGYAGIDMGRPQKRPGTC